MQVARSQHRTPRVIISDIELARLNLLMLAETYAVNRKNFAKIEIKYETIRSREIRNAYREEDKKPAFEIVKALIFEKCEVEYTEFVTAKAELEALAKLVAAETDSLSALQSELSQAREEFKFGAA